jgi:hypothetical protein
MVDKPRREFSDYISEAAIITTVSVIAYSIAFLYEAGYFSVYNIPLHLIQVQLDTVLIVLLTLSSVFLTLFFLINFITTIWPESWVIQIKLLRICLILIFPLWRLLLYGWESKDWLLYFIPLFIIILLEFILPLITYRKKKSLKEKFEADEIAESKPRSKTIFGRMQSFLGPIGYATILIFFLLCKMSYDAGIAKAHTQKKYYFLNDSTDTLVIRVYKDMIIGVKYNNVKKNINSSVILNKIGGNQPIELLFKNVGPLNFEDTENIIEISVTIENEIKPKVLSTDTLNNK